MNDHDSNAIAATVAKHLHGYRAETHPSAWIGSRLIPNDPWEPVLMWSLANGDPIRASIGTKYPESPYGEEFRPALAKDRPNSITVSLKRDPKDIARDIERRLLPEARRVWRQERASMIAHEQGYDERDAKAATLCAMLGVPFTPATKRIADKQTATRENMAELLRARQDNVTWTTWITQGTYVHWKVSIGGSVHIAITGADAIGLDTTVAEILTMLSDSEGEE